MRQKKIRGKIHYFGRWGRLVNGKLTRLPDDAWKEALEEYKAAVRLLHGGSPEEARYRADKWLAKCDATKNLEIDASCAMPHPPRVYAHQNRS